MSGLSCRTRFGRLSEGAKGGSKRDILDLDVMSVSERL